MSVRGNTSGEYFGEWFGPVEVVPGGMSANIGGSGTISADATAVAEKAANLSGSGGITADLVGVRFDETPNSGGYIRTSDRRRTKKEIDEARRKFGIAVPEEVEETVAQEAVAIAKTLTLPKKLEQAKTDDFEQYREKLIAWLEADLAARELTRRVKERDFMVAIMVSALIAA